MLDKSKKGQVTLFVILGLIILLAIILVVSFKSDTVEKIKSVQIFKPSLIEIEAENVKAEAEGCMTDVLEGGLFLIGLQGGYISVDGMEYTNITYELLLPYWPGMEGTVYSYYGNTNRIPSVQMAAEGLSSYLDEHVPRLCKTEKEGVDYGNFKSEVLITDVEVVVNADWDVTVRKENAEAKIEKMTIKVPVRLKVLLTLFRQMVDDQIEASKEKLCVSCWSRVASYNNLEIRTQELGKDTIFLIFDSKSKIAGGDYPFMLALMLNKE